MAGNAIGLSSRCGLNNPLGDLMKSDLDERLMPIQWSATGRNSNMKGTARSETPAMASSENVRPTLSPIMPNTQGPKPAAKLVEPYITA